MNALKLLISDHREVERLFKESEAATRARKRTLFLEIKSSLETHAWVEETIFYPTLQSTGDKRLVEITSEAIQEHIGMKCFLGELAAVSADASKFEPLFEKLVQDVRHHVKEEESGMFPAVEKRFSSAALEEMGGRMAAEKERFQLSAETIYG